jgi:hypothetical protein
MRQALAGACRPAQREAVLRETLRKLPWIKANKLVDKSKN